MDEQTFVFGSELYRRNRSFLLLIHPSLVCVSGTPQRFGGPPEGHVSRERREPESVGLCDHLGPAGAVAGAGRHL